MASATEHPVRFLDLPPELRFCVYSHIDFPTTCHTLNRVDSHILEKYWPVPPKDQIFDSRITLFKPPNPRAIDILLTCRLINEEARPILKRRIERIRTQPVRYLVDYSAARAIFIYGSVLQSCLVAAPLSDPLNNGSVWARTFLHTCRLALSQTRRRSDETRGPRRIEMTINHENDLTYGREVMETIWLIGAVRHYLFCPTRLVIIYKSPLPRIQMSGNGQMLSPRLLTSGISQMFSPSNIEGSLLRNGLTEISMSDKDTGVFVRPLSEEAFEKHLEGLKAGKRW